MSEWRHQFRVNMPEGELSRAKHIGIVFQKDGDDRPESTATGGTGHGQGLSVPARVFHNLLTLG